jgi:hypothetical protein
MNKNPMVTTGAAAGIVLVGIILIVMQMAGGSKSARPPTVSGAFFSDDDGKTYFSDDPTKIPPFDHNGKIAVGAVVFKPSTGGDPFVGYLVSNTNQLKAKLESEVNTGGLEGLNAYMSDNTIVGALIKKPGDPKWHAAGSKDANAAEVPRDASGKAIPVIPVNP